MRNARGVEKTRGLGTWIGYGDHHGLGPCSLLFQFLGWSCYDGWDGPLLHTWWSKGTPYSVGFQTLSLYKTRSAPIPPLKHQVLVGGISLWWFSLWWRDFHAVPLTWYRQRFLWKLPWLFWRWCGFRRPNLLNACEWTGPPHSAKCNHSRWGGPPYFSLQMGWFPWNSFIDHAFHVNKVFCSIVNFRWVACQPFVYQSKMEVLASTIVWPWQFPICGLSCWKRFPMICGMLATSVTLSPIEGGRRSALPMQSHMINPLSVTRQLHSGWWIRTCVSLCFFDSFRC